LLKDNMTVTRISLRLWNKGGKIDLSFWMFLSKEEAEKHRRESERDQLKWSNGN